MDIKALRKGLRDLKSSIEDFLDYMELDGDPESKPAEMLPPDVEGEECEDEEFGRGKKHLRRGELWQR